MKYYVHHIPGRLRIRIPSLRNNSANVERVQSLLNKSGVQTIKINPVTGSVVVNYDADRITLQQLLDVLQTNGFYHENQRITLNAQLQQASHRTARKVSRAMFGWAVSKVLEANGLSLIAAFI